MTKNFKRIFKISKPIIGMIHLAGENGQNKVKRALEELIIYQEEGIDAAIIEDYYGSPKDVYQTLKEISKEKLGIIIGINVLRNPYSAFKLASEFGAKFIQFDSVQTQDLDLNLYNGLRKDFSSIAVLGGIAFKYTKQTGNPLNVDLEEGKSRCDVIVTTGSGTGIETPIEKLKEFKKLLGNFPLIVGAGVNLNNVYEQLKVTNGAIIGSYFKPDKNTRMPIDRQRVRNLITIVKEVRKV